MSQHANIALADRSFTLSSAYYTRRSGDPTAPSGTSSMPSAPSQGVAYHGQADWPGYYAERASPVLQAQSSFNSYIVPAGPSSSSLAYPSSWQNTTTTSALTSVGPAVVISGYAQAIPAKSTNIAEYQAGNDALSHQEYPTSSQRTSLPLTEPSPEPPYLPSYAGRSDRYRSPSSQTHASVSEYIGWDSPGSIVEELQYPPPPLPNSDRIDQSPDAQSRRASPLEPAAAPASSSKVKVEPEDHDDCFIMELSGLPAKFGGGMGLVSSRAASQAYLSSLLSQSLAPPTEVPLRATQANKKMRAMMGVFRLNPFSMHNFGDNIDDAMAMRDDIDWDDAQPAWSGGEAHPLDEEPTMFEFQLDLGGGDDQSSESGTTATSSGEVGTRSNCRANMAPLTSSPFTDPPSPSQVLPLLTDSAHLRSFSPSSEFHPEDDDDEKEPSYEDHDQRTHPRQEDQEDGQHRDDQSTEQDQQSESWGDVDYANHSEVDSSSTTTRSVHTPFNDSPQALPTHIQTGYEHHTHSPALQPSAWDAVNEQYQSPEDHRFANQAPLIMPFKPTMAFAATGVRVPRLHTTTSHPYLRKNLQSNQPQPTPDTLLTYPQPTSLIQPQEFTGALLTQPTHHSYHHHPPVPQPTHILSPPQQNEHAYAHQHRPSQHYQEGHLPVDPIPSLMPNHLMGDLPQAQGQPPPGYMRIIRGARNPGLEYDPAMSVYGQRSASQASSGGGNHTPSSEAFHAPPPSSMALHYIQHTSNATMAGNRRWSLPETVGVHSHGGHY